MRRILTVNKSKSYLQPSLIASLLILISQVVLATPELSSYPFYRDSGSFLELYTVSQQVKHSGFERKRLALGARERWLSLEYIEREDNRDNQPDYFAKGARLGLYTPYLAGLQIGGYLSALQGSHHQESNPKLGDVLSVDLNLNWQRQDFSSRLTLEDIWLKQRKTNQLQATELISPTLRFEAQYRFGHFQPSVGAWHYQEQFFPQVKMAYWLGAMQQLGLGYEFNSNRPIFSYGLYDYRGHLAVMLGNQVGINAAYAF